VVPFAAGGPTDTLARILSERIAAELHTTIVVENIAGASGSIAGTRVARAAIPPRDQQTPAALAAFQKAETEKWWPIVKAADIKVE